MSSVQSEIILSRVRLYNVKRVVADAHAMLQPPVVRVAEDFDGWEMRAIIEAWGQTSVIKLRCPATWWQHLKLALRTRWPRLFRRLAVRFDEAIAENGAIVEGLKPLLGRHRVIPVHMPITNHSYVDDPSRSEDA